MGKSLCILSLIVETLGEGQKWAAKREKAPEVGQIKGPTRSTLIVVSSACKTLGGVMKRSCESTDQETVLINNWCKEIEE